MLATGARVGAVMPSAFVLTNIITLVLAIKYGHSQFTKSDLITASIAGAAIGAWLIFGARVALIAVAIATITSLLAVINKLRRFPGTEDLLSWGMVALATACSLAAILVSGGRDLAVLFQPTIALIGFGAVILTAAGPARFAGLLRVFRSAIPQVQVSASTLEPAADLVLSA